MKLQSKQAWQQLKQHFEQIQDKHMRDMFNQDPDRADRYSIKFNDILFDYSKNRINDETLKLLINLAKECDLESWINKIFSGEMVNHTEQRAVLHSLLRNKLENQSDPELSNLSQEVKDELEKAKATADAIRSRQWRGSTNQPITDIVNLGIGGSHLGPLMASEALRPYAIHDLTVHYVNNIDENHITGTLESLHPATTLFIIASKSFTTQDTMVNTHTAREWLLNGLGSKAVLSKHLLATTSNVPAAVEMGIAKENIFKMWDWVGGRYSMWSSIGLPTMISIGPENFQAFLDGAHAVDEHFKNEPLEKNIPVLMALLGVWYNNFFNSESYAILPYDQNLHKLPGYLQQADMESNGKMVDREGQQVDYSTGPIIFGEIGIAAQHAFYQLLHQGTKLVPADMIASIANVECIKEHHRALMANVFAQAEALMTGRTADEAREELKAEGKSEQQIEALVPYKVFSGNRPTNMFLYYTLDPATLGSLVAFYEHKIFVQGVIWNINSFDQWGVELGKKLAKNILEEINSGEEVSVHDSSTNQLINYYLKLKADNSGNIC